MSVSLVHSGSQQSPRKKWAITRGLFGMITPSELFAICIACDFFMVPAVSAIEGSNGMPEFPVAMAMVGCVLAQGNLLAAWLAWSDLPFFTRLIRHWIIASILFAVWTVGLAIGLPSQFAEMAPFVGLSVPLVSVSAQIPLWFGRQVFGWRLVQVQDVKNDAAQGPLSIRQLMLATFVVAVSLGLVRLSPIPDDGEEKFVWIVASLIACGTSTITLLPAGAMLMRTAQFRRGLTFAGLYAASYVSVLWLVVLTARWRGYPVPPLAVVLGASALILSFAGTVMLAAAVARSRGYRLVRGREPRLT